MRRDPSGLSKKKKKKKRFKRQLVFHWNFTPLSQSEATWRAEDTPDWIFQSLHFAECPLKEVCLWERIPLCAFGWTSVWEVYYCGVYRKWTCRVLSLWFMILYVVFHNIRDYRCSINRCGRDCTRKSQTLVNCRTLQVPGKLHSLFLFYTLDLYTESTKTKGVNCLFSEGFSPLTKIEWPESLTIIEWPECGAIQSSTKVKGKNDDP